MSFEVPKPGLPFPVTRPYTIASPPSQPGAIELLFNLVPGGPGSTFLFTLQKGDPVNFRGPAGTFVLREYPNRRLLFVATGTGIAPIRSMIHARLPSPTPVTLIWGRAGSSSGNLSHSPGAVLLTQFARLQRLYVPLVSFKSAAFCSSTLISTRSRLMSRRSLTNRLM